jgi:hypothetical protein
MSVSFLGVDIVLGFEAKPSKEPLKRKNGHRLANQCNARFLFLRRNHAISFPFGFACFHSVSRKQTTQRKQGSERKNSFVWSCFK